MAGKRGSRCHSVTSFRIGVNKLSNGFRSFINLRSGEGLQTSFSKNNQTKFSGEKKNTTTILMKRRGCLFLMKTRYDLRPKLVLVVVLVLENKTDSVRFDINLRTSCNLMMLRSVSDRKVPQYHSYSISFGSKGKGPCFTSVTRTSTRSGLVTNLRPMVRLFYPLSPSVLCLIGISLKLLKATRKG